MNIVYTLYYDILRPTVAFIATVFGGRPQFDPIALKNKNIQGIEKLTECIAARQAEYQALEKKYTNAISSGKSACAKSLNSPYAKQCAMIANGHKRNMAKITNNIMACQAWIISLESLNMQIEHMAVAQTIASVSNINEIKQSLEQCFHDYMEACDENKDMVDVLEDTNNVIMEHVEKANAIDTDSAEQLLDEWMKEVGHVESAPSQASSSSNILRNAPSAPTTVPNYGSNNGFAQKVTIAI